VGRSRAAARRPVLSAGHILVVNAGSTSLKLAVVEDGESAARVDSLEQAAAAAPLDAVGHRVVHGGSRFLEPATIDDGVLGELRRVSDLAPLHNAPALAAIDSARRLLPDVPHVAVFDTAFHATLPAESFTYPLPRSWRERWGIRRYGFHGLSVQWAAELVRVPRLVVAHLGGGCSVTAVLNGRSVDTTMGFTPLEGVPMATRSGSIDPGALLHVLRSGELGVDGVDHALEHESGLLGLSDRSGRIDELERAESEGDGHARLALDVFAHRVAQAVAAMATSLGGLDALVFTAGAGEGSPSLRERVCARLAFLGVTLDPAANAGARGDAEVAAEASSARVTVVAAREELVIARAVAGTLR
jgi:acetate kinase